MKTFTRRMIALSMTAALGLSSAGLAFADNYKDETVYVLTGNAGNVNKIIVSDWLKNKDGDASLVDASDLTDIENVKGDEKSGMLREMTSTTGAPPTRRCPSPSACISCWMARRFPRRSWQARVAA